MAGWNSAHDRQKLDRLRRLTNFGLLDVESPLVGLQLDTWYYLSHDNIGRLSLNLGQGVSSVTTLNSLGIVVLQTRNAFRDLLRLTQCIFTYVPAPATVQRRAVAVPISMLDQAGDSEQFVSSLGIESQRITSVLLLFDTLVTSRDMEGRWRAHWIPQSAAIDVIAESDVPYAISKQEDDAVWTAHFTCGCASLYRPNNRSELHRIRELWRTLKQQQPGIEVVPDDIDGVNYLITDAHPAVAEDETNADVSGRNLPLLRRCVETWERATSGVFHWLLDSNTPASHE